MHDQPLSGIHKFPPHEQRLYGAEKGDIKTALYLLDRIGRNSSEDPRGDADKAAKLIRQGFSIEPDSLPPQEIMEAALAIIAWAEHHNLKDWQVAGIGPVDVRQNMIPATAANVDLNALRPRNWTREMGDAWHRSIPNLEKAFDDLIAAFKEKNT